MGFHPRRIAAQRLLNATSALTPEVLFATISDKGVMAKDTIFQSVANVETGVFNITLPACEECNGPTKQDEQNSKGTSVLMEALHRYLEETALEEKVPEHAFVI